MVAAVTGRVLGEGAGGLLLVVVVVVVEYGRRDAIGILWLRVAHRLHS